MIVKNAVKTPMRKYDLMEMKTPMRNLLLPCDKKVS